MVKNVQPQKLALLKLHKQTKIVSGISEYGYYTYGYILFKYLVL